MMMMNSWWASFFSPDSTEKINSFLNIRHFILCHTPLLGAGLLSLIEEMLGKVRNRPLYTHTPKSAQNISA